MRVSLIELGSIMLILGATAGPLAAQQQDQESRIITDKWYVSLGTSLTDFTTEAMFGFGSVLGTYVRVEDDLGLDDEERHIRFNGVYAFNRKQAIDFTLGDTSREGAVTIDEEISIGEDGDEIRFQIGADVATRFDASALKVFYKYSFVNTGRTQAGIGAGLSVFDYSLELNGVALVDDGQGGQVEELARVSEDVLAPIPSFLLFIHHAFYPKLVFRATAGFFDISVDDFEGGLIETRLTIDYFFNKTIALGAGLEGSDIDFRDRGDDPLSIIVKETSAIFYLGLAF